MDRVEGGHDGTDGWAAAGAVASDGAGSAGGGVTRLAPSPTGALHLGNMRTFLVNWAMARRRGWRVVLRIEDLDTPRTKAGADEQAIELLEWLGLDWEAGPTWQSRDLEPYRAAMRRLAEVGATYPCALTRREIDDATAAAAASAPQADGPRENVYPASLRPGSFPDRFEGAGEREPGRACNWRFATPGEAVRFHDEVRGAQAWTPASEVGDFVIWTKRDQPSYQLAVVVDDARQGVSDVVRGDDLLDSTARQLLLYRALGLRARARWWPLPLVLGADGKRLAKRHGDTRLVRYRDAGVSAEAVVGLLAWWSGVVGRSGDGEGDGPEAMSAGEFAERFETRTLPSAPVTFGPEDEAWLMSSAR